MKKYRWYRKLIGGVWSEYIWYDCDSREKREWRREHNGRWTEHKGLTENHI